jgi:hypothetical protein
MNADVRRFLDAKLRNLANRARRLARLTLRSVGIRPQDLPYIPTREHFRAANARLAEIDQDVRRQLADLLGKVADQRATPDAILGRAALVEREVDRARRAYALFFDVFSQRGTTFAPALAGCDQIAGDCYQVVERAAPGLLRRGILGPVTYLEHGFSPATYRRGAMLQRLLGERTPFPLIRVPYDQVESPWSMGVLLHEIGHNLQGDLGIWEENRVALTRRVLNLTRSGLLARIWGRLHKEIFADLIALCLGGPAASRSMADFLSYPASRTLAFNPLSVHPTPYLRIFILAEMLRRMGFARESKAAQGVWHHLYTPHLPGRLPPILVRTAPRVIPHVVDEVAYTTRRGLAQKALVDVVPFTQRDEQTIQSAAAAIARGRVPPELPSRFAVSASRVAFERRLARPAAIATTVLHDLARRGAARPVAVPQPAAA